MILISPSLLSADFGALGADAQRMEKAGADWLHYDVMDGHFVPNISIGIPVLKSLKSYTSVPLDVHLMISEPLKYIAEFAKAGADIITFHVESDSDPVETIQAIREAGCKPSISVKPGTPAEAIFPYLELVDMVLVMTVEPGFGGQKMMPETLEKVRAARQYITEKGLQTDLQVDGGVKYDNIHLPLEAGANIFVAGSAVFGPDTLGETKRFNEYLASKQNA